MAEKTPKKPTPRTKGKGLTKKVGPFPLYVYLIGVALVVIYLYARHKNSGGTNPNGQFNGSLNQQTIPSGVVVPPATTSGSDNQGSNDGSTTYPTDYASQTDLANAISSINDNTQAAIAGITFPSAPDINITVPNAGKGSVSKSTSTSKAAAHKADPFGGVLSRRKTKSGATITKYRSGRVTEQAPGKKPYVVHK